MICPSCKEEISLSDLLITWHTPNDLGTCHGDTLAMFQTELKGYDARDAQEAFFVLYSILHPMKEISIEFEHDKLDCFFHWNPSETEVQQIFQGGKTEEKGAKPHFKRPVAKVKRVIQIIELEKPVYGIKVLLRDEEISPPISVFRGETVNITAHFHVDASPHENQKLGRKILQMLKREGVIGK